MDLVDWIVKQTGKISDNFNKYKFYVKQQPQIIDSSSVVVINTFNSRDMTATIPCSFRWFTIRNGVTTEAQQFKGNTYICEPADIGCILQVEITSSDPQCPGTALMSYGPVKFDVLLKKEIQMALSTGDSTFFVNLGQESQPLQCHLKVSQQRISISHMGSQALFTFNYNLIEPKFEVLHKFSAKVRIIFNPKYYDELSRFLAKMFSREVSLDEVARAPFIEIGFKNLKARDSFLLITKAFNTKKQLKSSSYVSNLQKQLDFTSILQKGNKNFDYLQHISQLERDILKLLQINSKNFIQKQMYLDQINKLQKQIQEIVSTYVKIIEQRFHGREDFQRSLGILKEKEEMIKFNKAQRQNNEMLNAKLVQLQTQNQMLRTQLNNKIQAENSQIRKQKALSDVISYDSFRKKSIIRSISSQEELPSQQVMRMNENLKIQLSEMIKKYENLQMEHQKIIEQSKVQKGFSKMSPRKIQGEYNVDLFDAKSAKSVKSKNHNTSHMSSYLHVYKDPLMSDPQKLQFSSETPPQKTPQFKLDSPQQLINLQQQNKDLRMQILLLQQRIVTLTSQFQQKQQKYKRKISQLSEQLSMYRRNNDVLNRSQHLSMEMEEYNLQQQNMLKKDNQFLKKEIQNYKELCQKYMVDAKKYKQLKKENSSILQQAGI